MVSFINIMHLFGDFFYSFYCLYHSSIGGLCFHLGWIISFYNFCVFGFGY